jgi:hypothetical protein
LELKGEKLQCQRIKFFPQGLLSGRGFMLLNQSEQARGKYTKFFVHAVFGYGWFSATAGTYNTSKCL